MGHGLYGLSGTKWRSPGVPVWGPARLFIGIWVHQALTTHGDLLRQHDKLLRTLMGSSAATSRAVPELTQQLPGAARVTGTALRSAAVDALAGVRGLHACDPEPFKEDLDKCWGFLLLCWLVFEQRPLSFTTDGEFSYWTAEGQSADVGAVHERLGNLTFDELEDSFKAVFDHLNHTGTATEHLFAICPGSTSLCLVCGGRGSVYPLKQIIPLCTHSLSSWSRAPVHSGSARLTFHASRSSRRFSSGGTRPGSPATLVSIALCISSSRPWCGTPKRSACAMCGRGKWRHKPPAGLLTVLLTPWCPWSRIALDFITGLPPSGGDTSILTGVDRFSKAAHLVPQPKLPSPSLTVCLQGLARVLRRVRGDSEPMFR